VYVVCVIGFAVRGTRFELGSRVYCVGFCDGRDMLMRCFAYLGSFIPLDDVIFDGDLAGIILL
jgi:hypothetical protein